MTGFPCAAAGASTRVLGSSMLTRYVARHLHTIDEEMAKLATHAAEGKPQTWEDYQRMVGRFQGLKQARAMLVDSLSERDQRDLMHEEP